MLMCQNCVQEIHPEMFTTYCVKGVWCARCGKQDRLAIVQAEELKPCERT